jgi:hypothetical protein
MEGECRIVLVHVAGKRMIWQGSDGLSQGDKNAGVMNGEEMMSFVPLHLRANDRSDNLMSWVDSWCSDKNGHKRDYFLQPEDWASAHQESETYVWSPPPAAADAAIESLDNRFINGRTILTLFPSLT